MAKRDPKHHTAEDGLSAPRPGGVRYVGGGRWIAGVPARDLTAEEVGRFPEVLDSPLYAAVED